MATQLGEFETELEDELEATPELGAHEFEGEGEFGDILGAIGNVARGLLGEEEATEGAHEFEAVHEGIHEGAHEFEGEEFLGTIARGIGGLLGGAGEALPEYEGVHEGLPEYESEYESEEFFRRIFRGIRGFVRRAAPVLRRVAKVAAPIVGTAVGGPLGGMLGRAVSSQMEGEAAGEFEGIHELEATGETHEVQGEAQEYEGESEGELEYGPGHEMTAHEAAAEMMAAVASRSASEAEAEAMTGAATVTVVSRADAAALRQVLPYLVRGTAVLTRILRQSRTTRPAVRAVPTIARRTTRILARRAAAGQPVTRRTAARVMAAQTRRVLGTPTICARALQRNVRATRAVRRARPRRVTM